MFHDLAAFLLDPSVVGWWALIVTVLYSICGMPAQIWNNFKNRHTVRPSLLFGVSIAATFSSWVWYGYVKADPYVFGSNCPGAICALVLLLQALFYRPRH
jgi:uncharacterized protein with PQ loop repeat